MLSIVGKIGKILLYGILPKKIKPRVDYCIGKMEKAKKRFAEYYDKKYFHFLENDLSGSLTIDVKIDYLIHAASFASSQYFGTKPVDTTIPNVLGNYILLDLAVKNRVKSMVYVSSGEVYGKTESDTIAEDNYGIADPLDLRYCYGESKRMGECLCNCYWHQYQVPVKIVRLGHTYGPTMDIENDRRVFSEFVGNAVRGENIVIKSDGSPMRAFCYSADATAAFFKVLLDGKNGEAYNIANMKGLISMKELAEIIVSIQPEKRLTVVFEKRPTDEAYIESNQIKHNVPNTTKLQVLGWECKYSIKDGFKRTIFSFKNN